MIVQILSGGGSTLTGWEGLAEMADQYDSSEESVEKRGAEAGSSEERFGGMETDRGEDLYFEAETSEMWSSTEAGEEAGDNESETSSEKLANRIQGTRKLVSEIRRVDDELFETEKVATEFGLDGLSRRYGLEKVLRAVDQGIDTMEREMARPRKGLERFRKQRFASDAITGIYDRIEPDANKRKALYAEMIAVEAPQEVISYNRQEGRSEYTIGDESANDKARLEAMLYVDEKGEIRVQNADFGENDAYRGLVSLRQLIKRVNNADSLLFGETVEQAKDTGQSVTEKLTEGMEKPGLLDLMGGIETKMIEGAVVADEQIEAQKAEINSDIANIEKDIIEEVRDEVKPFEASRSELAAGIVTMEDGAGRTILEEASRKMYDLILEKTAQASQKFSQEKADYYASLGEGVENFLAYGGDKVKGIAQMKNSFYGRRQNVE